LSAFVLGFHEMDSMPLSLVGGKGSGLGKLARIPGVRVPEGFCVTTEAYRKAVESNGAFHAWLQRLAALTAENREQVAEICAQIRQTLRETEMPSDVAEAVALHLARMGEEHAYAVRSSATAEDSPHASFAGQLDTYLNVIGREAILRQVRECWASLFTDRAVVYRMQNGMDHSRISMAVIVQRMVFPQASGMMFTADPATSNRRLLAIDAGFGLGEALVSGLVSADGYKVREGSIVEKRIAAKTIAVHAEKEGGTVTVPVDPDRQRAQTLTDAQILELAGIGRKIEAHFGRPQDIEWCLADDAFYIVQSRPITTLFPIPEADDRETRVYVSVGHQQMMTDPIKPLGLSFYLLTTKAPMRTAGGRLFVDVTVPLASPAGRQRIMDTLGQSDPLIKDALMNVIERGDILPPASAVPADANSGQVGPRTLADLPASADPDPSVVSHLIRQSQTALEEVKRTIQTKSGTDLLDFILEDLQQLKKWVSDPQSVGVIMAAMEASRWINENMREWLGEKNAADALAQSVPGNITSEMGLALLDVADAIRPYPEVIEYLQHANDENFLDGLDRLEGGKEARDAIRAYLDRYGMRCSGEIDITKPRWSEKPTALVPLILRNIRQFEPGESRRRFERGLQEAREKERELLERLKSLPDGEHKASETKRRIDLIRNFSGYREYPKYAMINRYFVYKQALLKEAGRLVREGVTQEVEDIYYLTFEELREAVRTGKADERVIHSRKEEYKLYEKLTPPRVITSDGEMFTGKYRREHLPPGAMAGLPVSSGVVEGRARVIFNMETANLEEGDILVTPFTDPSWTPLFVSVKGLVTEVGGLMTHGAVIAREYGLPAVVGVEQATKRIRDGQRIRVNGTEGYVEIL
jgi:Phosphoenolpyruvate synthase/pyruvate phosphate dikinase